MREMSCFNDFSSRNVIPKEKKTAIVIFITIFSEVSRLDPFRPRVHLLRPYMLIFIDIYSCLCVCMKSIDDKS